MTPLAAADFPLQAIGTSIYRRTESSPIATCPDMATAMRLAALLNSTELDRLYRDTPLVRLIENPQGEPHEPPHHA